MSNMYYKKQILLKTVAAIATNNAKRLNREMKYTNISRNICIQSNICKDVASNQFLYIALSIIVVSLAGSNGLHDISYPTLLKHKYKHSALFSSYLSKLLHYDFLSPSMIA